ncbi:MAG: hypothetical protein EOS09_27580 [Mesorhizobium sp.]|nr:MAG: hypothetical protein EOS09_27580 [Mesorhizobium sp.]
MAVGGQMNIAVWLKSLGLEQYVRVFDDNAIDAEILPSLTAEDLKEIGVGAAWPPQANTRGDCRDGRPAGGSVGQAGFCLTSSNVSFGRAVRRAWSPPGGGTAATDGHVCGPRRFHGARQTA